MNSLSSKQQSFVKLMKDGEDQERRGFELLSKRADLAVFFDALAAEGLFEPSRNSGPVAADKPGYFRVPYWPPLLYLEAAAKLAGEQEDAVLADKVMGVIRNVSQWRDGDGQLRDNHTTWYLFAKMLGSLPTNAVSLADIDLVPAWLTGRFDRSMAGNALASGALRKYLASGDPTDQAKACRILYHCTAVEFVDEGLGVEKVATEPRTVLDDFWLKELINATAAEFGRRSGKEAADIFLNRLTTVFAHAMGGRDTWLFRPAIEDHPQNYEWRGPYNRFVEGLRDTVLAWLDSDPAARPFVETLLESRSEIVERVAIHLVDQRFEALRELVLKIIVPAFFDAGHRHELHLFLKAHFRQFSGEEQTATLAIIRGLPLPDRGEDSERILRASQQEWLSPIAGQGYEPADSWLTELARAEGAIGQSPHPEFNSYHEMRWGFGPTPHNVEELVAFAERGTIVDRLNAFAPSDTWNGPSKRSLSDAVIDAVGAAPPVFLDRLPQFLDAKREYQYAVIAGFKKLWDAWDGKQQGLPWNDIWPKLLDFFEALLTDEDFWTSETAQEPALSPSRLWIPPVISEFLRAGTRSDDKAYAPDLLPRTLPLVRILLAKSEPQDEVAAGDALNRAINTAKGKAIEALLDHALRSCRLSDQAKNSHADAWQELQPLFDAQLAQCLNANFEFSALAGAYIGNLHYMNADWVHANFKKIFPVDYPANCLSALDGLAFSPFMKPIFDELIASGVMDWALRQDMKSDRARESLLQRLGVSYLWDQEQLDGPRFAYLFEAHRTGDLEELCQYFWMARGESLTDEQTERIFLFWDRCVTWSKTLESPPARLLSLLSHLSCYLKAIDEHALGWLVSVAPHTPVNYNADRLIEQLVRLADASPAETGQVLRVLLEAYRPDYDFEDRLKQLITRLAAHGASRADAILSLERVRHLPGMVQLYAQLSSVSVSAEPH
jgi:hypothetical protein